VVADNLVENESLDLGGRWQSLWRKGALEGRYGVEYFARRGVSATETDRMFGSPPPGLPTPVPVTETVSRTLDDGSVDEAAAHGSAGWSWGPAQLEAGARFTWIRQDNRGAEALEDTAWSGFLGAVIPLAPGFEAVANVGTGLRFPSLSERFFSGTTGRGTITANPDLEPERSLSFDAGLRHYGHKTFFAVYGFRTEIDDYIERVEIRPDELGFVNLFSGTIEGIEVEVIHTATRHLRLQASAHTMRGRSGTGEALEDIPSDRIEAGALWDRGRWRLESHWQHRFEKDDPGSGERPRDAADVVSAAIGYRLTDDLTLTLRGDNLLGELYYSTADRKDVPAPGRSVGLALGWRAR
jgi:iron complex outermembrane receptor protein